MRLRARSVEGCPRIEKEEAILPAEPTDEGVRPGLGVGIGRQKHDLIDGLAEHRRGPERHPLSVRTEGDDDETTGRLAGASWRTQKTERLRGRPISENRVVDQSPNDRAGRIVRMDRCTGNRQRVGPQVLRRRGRSQKTRIPRSRVDPRISA
jgi:hypothetical protein